jgi:hypothetical protein
MSIAQHVKGFSTFAYYRENHLYYTTDTGVTFPIPIEDAAGATFIDNENSIFFMRWIRKHFDTLKATT